MYWAWGVCCKKGGVRLPPPESKMFGHPSPKWHIWELLPLPYYFRKNIRTKKYIKKFKKKN